MVVAWLCESEDTCTIQSSGCSASLSHIRNNTLESVDKTATKLEHREYMIVTFLPSVLE